MSALRGHWGYVIAAVGSIVTFVLLFRPWITASGPDGRNRTTAFGRIDVTTNYLNFWSQAKPRTPPITGLWAILASVAIIITVFAVVVNLRLRIEALSRLAAGSALAAAFFVIVAVLYINSKGPALKGMTARTSDLGGHIGSLMDWAIGDGKLVVPGIRESAYSTAGLTHWAILAIVTALGSAIAAVVQWIRNGGHNRVHLQWRLPVVATSRPPADPEKTD